MFLIGILFQELLKLRTWIFVATYNMDLKIRFTHRTIPDHHGWCQTQGRVEAGWF